MKTKKAHEAGLLEVRLSTLAIQLDTLRKEAQQKDKDNARLQHRLLILEEDSVLSSKDLQKQKAHLKRQAGESENQKRQLADTQEELGKETREKQRL